MRRIRRVRPSFCTIFENKRSLELAVYNATQKAEDGLNNFNIFKVSSCVTNYSLTLLTEKRTLDRTIFYTTTIFLVFAVLEILIGSTQVQAMYTLLASILKINWTRHKPWIPFGWTVLTQRYCHGCQISEKQTN